MGLGYLFIEAVYRATGWDTRMEAFATAGLFLVILALAESGSFSSRWSSRRRKA
jgi:hypothetical protein